MTGTLLIELAVKSTVVAGAALVLLGLLGRRSAAERSWVAHAALVVLAALPAAVVLLPRWRLMPPVERAPIPPGMAVEPSPVAATIDPSLWLQVVYVGGVALLLLATLVAVLRLVALRRGAAVLADPHWLTALARAKARMKVTSGAALLVSTAVASPVSWGLIKPTIVVNQGLVAAKDDAEAVIAHELAHVVRRDWAKLIGARLVTALFWFNPLVWALANQCHHLREEAADDAVLGAEVSSADYANLLIEAARCHGRGLAAAHGVAPGKGSLHRRVTRVLDAAARRTPTRGAWGVGVVAGALLFAGPLAALTLEPAVTIAAEAAGAVTDPETAPTTVTVAGASARKAAPARTTAGARTPVQAKVAAPAVTVTQSVSTTKTKDKDKTKGKGKLTLAGDKFRMDAGPALSIGQPGAPRLTLAADAGSGAPKVAIGDGLSATTSLLGKPGGKVLLGDGLSLTGKSKSSPSTAITITGKASASSSGSHTLTTNGKTLRVETGARGAWNVDEADWRKDAADQRDRLRDQADARRDEADRRRDEAERIDDERERRKDEVERLRDQRDDERDAARDARRQVEARAAKERRALAAEARRVEQQAAVAALARQKAAATLP